MSEDASDVALGTGLPQGGDTGPTLKIDLDPEFPFGRPENINWAEVDPMGHQLLKEINYRPWMKSTEYHAGSPITDCNIYEVTKKLELEFVRGVIPDIQFRRTKQTLREEGISRVFLNVNVYNLPPFIAWVRSMSVTLLGVPRTAYNPMVIRLNPLRATLNFSIHWDYWTIDEKVLVHQIMLDTLQQIPV